MKECTWCIKKSVHHGLDYHPSRGHYNGCPSLKIESPLIERIPEAIASEGFPCSCCGLIFNIVLGQETPPFTNWQCKQCGTYFQATVTHLSRLQAEAKIPGSPMAYLMGNKDQDKEKPKCSCGHYKDGHFKSIINEQEICIHIDRALEFDAPSFPARCNCKKYSQIN